MKGAYIRCNTEYTPVMSEEYKISLVVKGYNSPSFELWIIREY